MRNINKQTLLMLFSVLGILFLFNSCKEERCKATEKNMVRMLHSDEYANMCLAKFVIEKWLIDEKSPSLQTVMSYMKIKDEELGKEPEHVPIFVDYDNRYKLFYNKSNLLLISHPQQYGTIPYVNKTIGENDVIYSLVFIPLKWLDDNSDKINNELRKYQDVDDISLDTYKYLTKYVKEQKMKELLVDFNKDISKFRKAWKETESLVSLPDDDTKTINAYMQKVALKDIMDLLSQNKDKFIDFLRKHKDQNNRTP